MKRFISLLLITSLLLPTCIIPVQAANDITVKVDGKALSFDVPPQTINGRTMVPMRAIFENLGAEVQYYPANKIGNEKPLIQAKKEGALTDIGMFIDIPQLFKRNVLTDTITETIELDAAPTVIDGRTLVPVRAIAKAFDCAVAWDGATKTVSITTTAADVPAVSEPTPAAPVKSITLNEKEKEMVIGEMFLLKPEIEPAVLADSAGITWKSSVEKVASVFGDGLVLAGKPGRTTITATTANGKTASCRIIVKDVEPLVKDREYGPMKIDDTYTSYDGFPMVLNSNHVKSFVFTGIEATNLNMYKLTASIAGKVTDSKYADIDVYFYNAQDQCIGKASFIEDVGEDVNYNISEYTYVDKKIVDDAQYIKFFSSSGKEAKKL